jgi:hypothetical protein
MEEGNFDKRRAGNFMPVPAGIFFDGYQPPASTMRLAGNLRDKTGAG